MSAGSTFGTGRPRNEAQSSAFRGLIDPLPALRLQKDHHGDPTAGDTGHNSANHPTNDSTTHGTDHGTAHGTDHGALCGTNYRAIHRTYNRTPYCATYGTAHDGAVHGTTDRTSYGTYY